MKQNSDNGPNLDTTIIRDWIRVRSGFSNFSPKQFMMYLLVYVVICCPKPSSLEVQKFSSLGSSEPWPTDLQ